MLQACTVLMYVVTLSEEGESPPIPLIYLSIMDSDEFIIVIGKCSMLWSPQLYSLAYLRGEELDRYKNSSCYASAIGTT